MTDDDARMREIAREAAAEAVEDVLAKLGINTKNWEEVQADFRHLRSWRQSTETIKRQGIIVATSTFIIGLLGLLWAALRGQQGGP